MPLSPNGLWDAEIITPALKSPVRVRYATPGVVTTPANRAVNPGLSQTLRQLRRDHRTGFASIHTDQNRFRPQIPANEVVAQRYAKRRNRLRVEWRIAGNAADSVSSK